MKIVSEEVGPRRDLIGRCIMATYIPAGTNEDERHDILAALFLKASCVVGCWPDREAPDGYHLAILKGAASVAAGDYKPGSNLVLPVRPAAAYAMNLSALYGDDRVERRRDLEGYLRRHLGFIPTPYVANAKRYFERYDARLMDMVSGSERPNRSGSGAAWRHRSRSVAPGSGAASCAAGRAARRVGRRVAEPGSRRWSGPNAALPVDNFGVVPRNARRGSTLPSARPSGFAGFALYAVGEIVRALLVCAERRKAVRRPTFGRGSA